MTHAWLVYCLRGPKGSPTSRSDPPAWSWDREKSCRSQTPAAAVVRSLGWGAGKAKVVEKQILCPGKSMCQSIKSLS